MVQIQVLRNPSQRQLDEQQVRDWPVWSADVSRFDWTCQERETCYLPEGEVTVAPVGGMPATLGGGDYAVYPKGMSCVWDVTRPVRKHYRFG